MVFTTVPFGLSTVIWPCPGARLPSSTDVEVAVVLGDRGRHAVEAALGRYRDGTSRRR